MIVTSSRRRGRLATGAVCLTAVVSLAACSSGSGTAATGSSSSAGPKVALLLPETQTARYEARDRPTFSKQFAESCPSCQLLYYNAVGDSNKQLSQVESALTEGAKVLVIGPVDSNTAASLAAKAKAQGAMVMSYDRVIYNADLDYSIKYDNIAQGRIGMQSLVNRLKAQGKTSGNIVMINGSITDSGSKPEKTGAHQIVDASGFTVAAEYDTPDWDPAKAQTEMQQAITKIGATKVDGVYAGNDGMASGAIAALKAAGVNPLPPVTGLDTQLDAIQRMVNGEQYESTFLPVETEATIAAKVAASLAMGKGAPSEWVNGTVDNGKEKTPAYLLPVVEVTVKDIQKVLIDSGYLTAEKICTPAYAAGCKRAGLL